ncbi:MAG: UbiA family prenyltransferase [Phycisphaerales bacterium]
MSASAMAWLRLLRVSNYPTVVSNALVGCAIGSIGGEFAWRAFALAAAALLLLYAAGMALNDAVDAPLDRLERPDRPIPSGQVPRPLAFAAASACTAAAMALLWFVGRRADSPAFVLGGALVACIVLYDTLHRVHPLMTIVMAACRGLAILTAAACVLGDVPFDHINRLHWASAGAIAGIEAAYVLAISLVARAEAEKPTRVRIVVRLISAICLLDAGLLAVLGRFAAMGLALACFAATLAAQRKVIGS